jgi:exonuclease I
MSKKSFYKPSSKLTSHIFCYDLECGSASWEKAEVLECAGVVIDLDILEIKEDGIFGPVLVKPNWDLVEQGALAVNKIIPAEVNEKGLDQKVFFDQLVAFLQKFQKSNKKWDALIPAGYNTVRYDDRVLEKLAKKYNYIDSSGDSLLFHPFHNFDLMNILRVFFYSTNTLESFSLENVNRYFGIDTSKSHTAMGDVISTAKILCRFLKFYKSLTPKYLEKFHNCFSEENNGQTNS